MPKKTAKIKNYKVSGYIFDALKALLPPENKTVSEWAEENRVLDSRSSDTPGKWKNSLTPYLVGIMDAFNNYEVEEIVFCKPTQVGGTEAMQNMIGYIVGQEPAPTMIVYPSDVLGEATVVNRLRPMITSSPALKKQFRERASAKDELQFDNMYIAITGANSPSNLASRPIKNLFLDEVDKYPSASKKEADPISLGRERVKTFRGSKVFMTSTPTTRTGHIWRNLEDCDVEYHYFVPCPHCAELIEFKFSQLIWPNKESGLNDMDRADLAAYYCQKCGGQITDRNKSVMLRQGEWKEVRRNATIGKKVGFWLNTLYSPFTSFADIAKEWMRAKLDVDVRHNFINSWLAEPWEDTKLKTSAELVLERQTDCEMYTVPEWAEFLTGGVDVQESSLYWTIRAWGKHITSQNIAHGQAFSFADITNVMNLSYKKVDGTSLMVQLALIDSGDQTDLVYDYVAENSEWALPCKGTDKMLAHYKISTVNKATSRAYGMQLVLVDGGKYKDMIASRMRRENGSGSWMVYNGCDREYAEQVTAEHKVTEKSTNGRETTRWVPKKSHADNHYGDAEVYCMAAADILGVRTLHLQDDETPAMPETPMRKKEDAAFNEENNSWINSGNNDSWL